MFSLKRLASTLLFLSFASGSLAGEEVVIAEPTFLFTNADEQQIEHTSIGPLEIGMSLSEIKFILKEKPLISKRLRNNDYGTYEQSLTFRKTGLKITTAQPSLENSTAKINIAIFILV